MPRFPFSLQSTHRLVAVFLMLFVGVWLVAGFFLERERQEQAARMDRTTALAEAAINQYGKAFGAVNLLTRGEADALRTYRNKEHVDRAKVLGINALADRSSADALEGSATLVKLEDNAFYVVEDLDYSVPYVTRSTATLLDLIGKRFQDELAAAGLPRYRYVITSVTRTLEDQKRLRRTNGNAASVSSHYHATTVDIHYHKFDVDEESVAVPDSADIFAGPYQDRLGRGLRSLAHTRQQKLKALMGRTLLSLQKEGKVLVIYERRQPVYHITLGQKLPERPTGPALSEAVAPHAPTRVSARAKK